MPQCQITDQSFVISDQEKDLIQRITPKFSGKSFPIPLPTLCPDERARLRSLHRNEQHLYRNKSCFSQNPIISVYPLSEKTRVISKEEWFSDAWDPMDYDQDPDLTKPFFHQYYALQQQVPRASTVTSDNQNCEYTTGTAYCKDCYLINSSEHCQNCSYGKLLQHCQDVFDSSYIYESELLYEGFNIKKGYNCAWVHNSQNITDCFFCDNLRNCQNCFLCTNLVGKQFYFGNEKLSEAEYHKKVQEVLQNPDHLEQAKTFFSDLKKNRTYKYAEITNSENCTGDFIISSQNCLDCYDLFNSQDCRYVHIGTNIKNCIDCANMYLKPELSYQVLGTIGTYNVHFCLYVFDSADLLYCEQCYSCEHCFGCIGLRKKSYCIFNQQYTKETYEATVAQIITHMQRTGEWGQYFPAWMSPFPYNKTVSQGYFPLSKEEAQKRHYTWEDETTSNHLPQDYVIPPSIKDVDDTITQKILACEVTGKNYRIQKNELRFYQKMNLPIPRKGPETRYQQRMNLRLPRHLHPRTCPECHHPLQSPLSPEKPEKILCEACYQKEVC